MKPVDNRTVQIYISNMRDGFVKNPDVALHPSSLRRTQKYVVFLADLRALFSNFLQSRPKFDFLREHHAQQSMQIFLP